MFAIDGVKLPSNASKAKSGKRKDFMRQAQKMEQAVEKILSRHRANDLSAVEARLSEREQRQVERLKREAQQINEWLQQHPQERKSAKGKPRLSNRTDNESAKMPTDKGVVQGYTGVAAVDEKHQIIIEAQAHGTGSEQELLLGVVEALEELRAPHTIVAADSGYYSEANLEQLEAKGIQACIPDNGYRKRDPRYEGQEQHKSKPDALWDKSEKRHNKPRLFRPCHFKVAQDFSHCICPAGKRLSAPIHHLFEQLDEQLAVERTFIDAEPERPLRRHRRGGTDRLALSRTFDHRGLTADPPGLAMHSVGAKSGF